MPVEVVAQETGDPNQMIFHSRNELSDGLEEGARGQPQTLGAFGRLVLDIRGVSQVSVIPYAIMVLKSPAYSWDEIRPKIVGLLSDLNSIEAIVLQSPGA